MLMFRNITRSVLVLLATLVVATAGQAAEPRHSERYGDDYRSAYQQYLAATDGDSSATRQALERFTELHEAHPDDPVALMLMGSSQALRGRDAWMPWSKLSHTEDGLDNMEQAQSLLNSEYEDLWFEGLPVSLMVPAMTGITYVEVPSMFSRFEQGLQLLESAMDHPRRDDAWPAAMTSIYRYTVQAALEVGDQALAEEAIGALEALDTEDEYTQRARELMAEEG